MGGIIGGGGDGGAGAALAQQKADTERLRKEAEAEKRDLNEQIASGRMARARGGARMLLSEERLNPEEGLGSSATLG
jgi:mevalonate kinase